MSKLKLILLINSTLLTVLIVTACDVTSPTATPTPEITPLPTGTPTLSISPTPVTPTLQDQMDMGGYKLAYQCFGQGSPTVIVEAGGGDKPTVSYTWHPVIQEVQTFTRICIYNRAQGLPTSQDIAADLHTLLQKIPLTGPYILVGHSLGGYHVRVYADMYPEEVAGLMLVDPTNPNLPSVMATAYPTYSPDENTGITLNRLTDTNAFPTPDIDGLDFNASTAQVRQTRPLGDLPLVVISADLDPDQWAVPGFTPEDTERIVTAIFEAQADLATLSSQGVFLVAHTPKHFISLNDPQIIIEAIAQMVEEIRHP